jgi:hypothetical protein
MTRLNRFVSVLVATLALSLFTFGAAAQADTASCHSTLVKQLRKFKKIHLKQHIKCLKLENRQVIPGPCPDSEAQAKIDATKLKVEAAIAAKCTPADLAALEFRTDCVYDSGGSGIEATCAGLNVLAGPNIDPTLLAQCLECWKGAELSEYIATLYASHAVGVCAGTTNAQSTVCSDLECTTPLPDQIDLTGGEGDCQHGIGKAGFKYIFKREKILEKCALEGGTQASCLADTDVQEKLTKIEQSKSGKIHNKCGNRDPVPSTPFCCRTGAGNSCSVAADRDDCVMNLGGTVQEDKTCNAGSCDSVMGNKKLTWWAFCPESNSCPGTALSTLDDLIDCVDASADTISDELLCLQFRGNGGADWPCPASE